MSYTSFKAMEHKLAGRPGVTNPAGLAATIARNKYGAKAVEHAAKTGTSLRGTPTKRHGLIKEFVKRHG